LTLPVLIILAVLWAVVLVPPLLRSRSQHTADSIVDFNYKLDVLGRTNGNLDESEEPAVAAPLPVHPVAVRRVPARPSAAQRSAKRRRDVASALAVGVVLTLLLAVVSRAVALWMLQGLADLLAVTYAGLWAWWRSVQTERLTKVRYMPDLRVPELRHPAMALRRSASS